MAGTMHLFPLAREFAEFDYAGGELVVREGEGEFLRGVGVLLHVAVPPDRGAADGGLDALAEGAAPDLDRAWRGVAR